MSHDDENTGAPGAFGTTGTQLADERVPETIRAASDTDAELAALRRDLLLYGIAGQAARMRVGAGT
jgi:hypothetical protein